MPKRRTRRTRRSHPVERICAAELPLNCATQGRQPARAGAADLANHAAALALLQLAFPEAGAPAVRRAAAAGSLVASVRLAAAAVPERRRRAALGRLRRTARRLPRGARPHQLCSCACWALSTCQCKCSQRMSRAGAASCAPTCRSAIIMLSYFVKPVGLRTWEGTCWCGQLSASPLIASGNARIVHPASSTPVSQDPVGSCWCAVHARRFGWEWCARSWYHKCCPLHRRPGRRGEQLGRVGGAHERRGGRAGHRSRLLERAAPALVRGAARAGGRHPGRGRLCRDGAVVRAGAPSARRPGGRPRPCQ